MSARPGSIARTQMLIDGCVEKRLIHGWYPLFTLDADIVIQKNEGNMVMPVNQVAESVPMVS